MSRLQLARRDGSTRSPAMFLRVLLALAIGTAKTTYIN